MEDSEKEHSPFFSLPSTFFVGDGVSRSPLEFQMLAADSMVVWLKPGDVVSMKLLWPRTPSSITPAPDVQIASFCLAGLEQHGLSNYPELVHVGGVWRWLHESSG